MSLLSTLAAHDLGYLSTDVCCERLDATLTTLEGLERHQGHFLNWYDTATLAPLHPRYVSTVDSGNLAGALIALAQGLHELEHRPQTARAAARRAGRRRRPAARRCRRRQPPAPTRGGRSDGDQQPGARHPVAADGEASDDRRRR